MTINGERGRGPRAQASVEARRPRSRPQSPLPLPRPRAWALVQRGPRVPPAYGGGGGWPHPGSCTCGLFNQRGLGPPGGNTAPPGRDATWLQRATRAPRSPQGREPGEGPRAPDPEGPGSKDKGLLGWLVLFRHGEAAWARAAWLGILGSVPALSAPRERKREAVVGEPRWSRGLASCVPRLGISPSPTEETVLWCLGPRSLARFAGHLPGGMCQAVNVPRLSCCRGRGCGLPSPHTGDTLFMGVWALSGDENTSPHLFSHRLNRELGCAQNSEVSKADPSRKAF